MTTVTNGVNVQALLDAREVLKGAPEAAQFTWRASASWKSGVHSTIKVQSFFGLGQEQSHKQEWVFEADHPEVFAAEADEPDRRFQRRTGLCNGGTGRHASATLQLSERTRVRALDGCHRRQPALQFDRQRGGTRFRPHSVRRSFWE